ncbi:2-keto-4-pentenoate hydratase [Streptomyces europaeiscabiei]|uniref:2-keto-4-pentenoate hydratase n=1 Tax=Streptomyces europaeiscabiei TaxID=146819 RepID=UPI0029B173F9|nr:fumarylacetoacetate hydrolase family protein [Streptomyces europaeiscabiei]MDX2760407.1 fumarylacetoacetate hydrolase family protein [Streptomyces europaeiscabiei]
MAARPIGARKYPAGHPSGSEMGKEVVLAGLAKELTDAARTRVPVRRLSERFPGLTVQDAYRIQRINVEARVAAGDRVAGHKIGLTSAAMQEQMGIDEPDSGVVVQSMVAPGGCLLRPTDYMNPRIETEIAFRLGRDLAGPADMGTVRSAVVEVFLAFEVLDTVYTSWDITLVDSIADNAACAGVITGQAIPFDPARDLAAEKIRVEADGVVAATGEGRDILGDPLKALVWLTHQLPVLGTPLRAGDIVLAGSVHASLPLTPGTHFRATSTQLPTVHLRVD